MYVRVDALELAENTKQSNVSLKKGLKILIVPVTSVWLTISYFAYLWIKRRKRRDFGMARIFRTDQIQEKTNKVVGTYGYMSPEYAILGKFSTKSDVFSFGVILLEVVSGKKNNGFHEEDPSLSLIEHVWELWRQGRGIETVDSSMEGSYPKDEAMRCIQIGLLCVQELAEDRPTMVEVVKMLGSVKGLPTPKQPASIFRKSTKHSNSITADQNATCSINELTITSLVSR
ncbi:Cysteine-rich receptor-like protein kinase 5 [Euphorbia peplus]|nr:Cysteine-rich receptor-like protein kinase 5 [Euphorbia peplus]